MCGRFVRDFTWQDLCEMLGIELPDGVDGSRRPFDLAPSWNVAPLQHTPVVRSPVSKHTENPKTAEKFRTPCHEAEEAVPRRVVACPKNGLEVALLRWGLIPAWARDESIASRLINARAETIASKPSYRVPFARQRCVIPVSGFYEWKAGRPDTSTKQDSDETDLSSSAPSPNLFGIEEMEGSPVGNTTRAGSQKNTTRPRKQPYYITRCRGTLLALAGLWDIWQRPASDTCDPSGTQASSGSPLLETFTIITTAANATVAPLHNRMPAILPTPEAVHTWLDPATPRYTLEALLVPAAEDLLCSWPVSSRVNSPCNNTATLIEPAGKPRPSPPNA